MVTLVRDLLVEFFTEILKDPDFPNRHYLLLLDRGLHADLRYHLYNTVVVTKASNLNILVSSLLTDVKRISRIKYLRIQTGCAVITTPAIPRHSSKSCRVGLSERPACDHLCLYDRATICVLLSIVAPYVRTLVIHSMDPITDIVNLVRITTFNKATDVEVPAEMICFRHAGTTPFPSVQTLKLAFCPGIYSDHSMIHMDFRSFKELRQAIFSFWKFDAYFLLEALLSFRAPLGLQGLGLELDNGMTLPLPLESLSGWGSSHWLLVLMDPDAVGFYALRWGQFIRYGSMGSRDRVEIHRIMDSMVLLNDFKRGGEWEAMSAQMSKKIELNNELDFM
ncbi:hypothetical protein VNI00_016673 [Paramarasmius palmivorus]|uniref:Uncharacterized protein n=1 Tax=Paramarasmius palmivorus TaxID=297713 RepID=A0AAW0BBN9_9AGAR